MQFCQRRDCLLGRFSITPVMGSKSTSVSLVWHRVIAICHSIAVLTEDMLVSCGHVRRGRAAGVVKDSLV